MRRLPSRDGHTIDSNVRGHVGPALALHPEIDDLTAKFGFIAAWAPPSDDISGNAKFL